MFFKVPIIDGVLDIDYNFMLQGNAISDTEAVVQLKEGFELRDSWKEIPEEEFLSYFPKDEEQEEPINKDEVLGEFITQQMLKNAQLEQKLDAIGQSLVQLLLQGKEG